MTKRALLPILAALPIAAVALRLAPTHSAALTHSAAPAHHPAPATQQSQITVTAPQPDPPPIPNPLITGYPDHNSHPHGQITGTVLDLHDHPIRYAQLYLQNAHPEPESPNAYTFADLPSRGANPGPTTAFSNLQGVFTFRDVRPGDYLINAHAPGFLLTLHQPELTPPIATVAAAAVTHATIHLAPAATIEGAILFDDKAPAIGLKVEIRHPAADRYDNAGDTTTDDTGHWRITSLSPGDYIISVAMPDAIARDAGFLTAKRQTVGTSGVPPLTLFYGSYGPTTATIITLYPPEHRTLDPLVIHPSNFHSLTVAVTSADRNNAPVNGGDAFLNSKVTGYNTMTNIDLTGTAHFPYVPPGDYTLTVRAADNLPTTFEPRSDFPGFPEAIRNYFDTTSTVTMPTHDLTLPPISSKVQWTKPNTTPAVDARMLTPPTTGGSLTIHVDTPTGPARFARIHLEPITEYAPQKRLRGFSAFSALDGSATLTHLPAGDYVLFAELDGFISPVNFTPDKQTQSFTLDQRDQLLKTLPHITITEGGQQQTTLTLQPGSILTGHISFDDGAPAIGVAVDALHNDVRQLLGTNLGLGGSNAFQTTKTDGLGNYRITGLPATTYRIQTLLPAGGINGSPEPSGFVPATWEQTISELTPEVTTTASQTTTLNLTIPLSTFKTLHGRVTIASRTSLETVSLELTAATPHGITRRLDITGDGTFAFTNIPPGAYTLRTRGWQTIPGRPGQHRTQTLEANQSLTIAPTGEPKPLTIPLSTITSKTQ